MVQGSHRNNDRDGLRFGNSKKKRKNDRVRSSGNVESLEQRMLLTTTPQLIGILPNDGEILEEGQVLNTAPTELTFRFTENSSLEGVDIASQIRIIRSGQDGVFTNGNNIVITPGYAGVGDQDNEAVVRFSTTLVDDRYQIEAFGQTVTFDLDLGAKIVSVVPQPITRSGTTLSQARNQIVVYFNDDDLRSGSASDQGFYQLIFTNDTATNADNGSIHRPTRVVYDPVSDSATLTFAQNLEDLATGEGTYRLRIGTDEVQPAAPLEITVDVDSGSSFSTALDLGQLTSTSKIVSAEIEAEEFSLQYPGSNDDPGHRDLQWETGEQHITDQVNDDYTAERTVDTNPGVSTIGYVFRDVYGADPRGVPLRNLITEAQKQRTREIFSLYSQYIGAQFFEVDEDVLPDLLSAGVEVFSIVTGDLRAINPTVPTGPGGVIGLAGSVIDPVLGAIPTAIMDNAEAWDDTYGEDWFETGMHEIGHLLGLGHTYDLPPGTIMGNYQIANYEPEPVFPGDNDIVHAQSLHRPESVDIDLYQFNVQQTGLFSAETIAERQTDSSLLDTVIQLYRQDSAGNKILVARNDDYYSNDSFLEMELTPGTYFLGVTAKGNDQYDADVEDSGSGGRTQGEYDLRLNFRPQVNNSLVDLTGTALDGDADGNPGGVFNYWFKVASPENTIYVDKAASGNGTGSLSSPFKNIASAFAAAAPGDVVRIVGNGGADGNLSTLADNLAYEIGFNRLNQPLQDGSSMEVPQGVTVMIDEGTVFKIRRARIGVGSSSPNVNRSAAALQVLGTPNHSVIFTSYNDQSIGVDTEPLATSPSPGDWGGIVFQNDVDRAEGRFEYERQGIFLNYVNHADFRFGGGEVIVNSVQQIVTPIQMVEARPTLSHNVISRSADAAMSADPNSFEETNFHAPRYQQVPFTSDYTRVGPDIHDNRLTNNSINALFVSIQTASGADPKKLTVSARFDDRDIVHAISENLVVEGTPGGPLQSINPAPAITNTRLTPVDGGSLGAGDYSYKFTYVEDDGTETPASAATATVTLLGRGVQGTVRISSVPQSTRTDVVTTRIYRSETTGIGPYTFVGEVNKGVRTFVDDGSVIGGAELNEQQVDLNARLDARLTIDPGMVIKMDGAHIDVSLGGDLYAEAQQGHEVVFTSMRDDRYGASGSFDTNNDGRRASAKPGDWGGISAGPLSTLSIDHGVISYAGGVTKVEGNFAGFNPIEIHQATARVTNSLISNNAEGTGGQAPTNRYGRGFNGSGDFCSRCSADHCRQYHSR
ncbi:MAG: hypothetical protein R3C28_12010 [Pirellulaceae bacterium]